MSLKKTTICFSHHANHGIRGSLFRTQCVLTGNDQIKQSNRLERTINNEKYVRTLRRSFNNNKNHHHNNIIIFFIIIIQAFLIGRSSGIRDRMGGA